MNRLGILVDLSHVSDETFDAALALTKAPAIVSHSSCRYFTPKFERNLDDGRIRALAKKGGVLQINFGSAFLTKAANENSTARHEAVEAFVKAKGIDDESEEAKAFDKQWRKENPLPRATLDDVVAHVDHVVKLVGVDHKNSPAPTPCASGAKPSGWRRRCDPPSHGSMNRAATQR
jgi:membrane dipeptidase